MNYSRLTFILGLIVAAAVARILPHPWNFTPVGAVALFAGARYAVTATVPTMALLTMGMLYWLPARAQPWAMAVLAAGLWFVSLHVLLTVQMPFYQCLLQAGSAAGCLP